MSRFITLVVLLALTLLPTAPLQAEEEKGGYQKLDNMIVEMWDKDGNFHTLVAKMQAYFPTRPQIPKTLGEKIKHRLQSIPYEEFRKPGGTQLIKDVTKEVLQDDPGTANVEEVYIMFLSF